MITAPISPSHPGIAQFRAALHNFASLNVTHETGIRTAFQNLLQGVSHESGLTLVTEQTIEGTKIRPDGTLHDIYNLPRGYWESKDTNDDLEAEIGKKKRKGYPFTNILFEDTRRAVLFQNQKRIFEADLTDATQTATLLSTFLTWQEPDPTSFDNAMARFGEVIPDLAKGLIDRINTERKESATFANAFDSLETLCRETLNPQIQTVVVVEMLAQHLLTERLFRTIFDNADFVQRNVIAQKVEETIRVMMARSFNRGEFTRTLDKYYFPIETKAKESSGWEQKQAFLNTLYERFFQDFSKKAADTQGIVYTPQPIVNFMVESVDALLQSEFGKSLSDKGVVVLDPCVGTGNFMQNLLRRLSPLTLTHKYQNELFCNENMLLPYYIASLNIEHTYWERAGTYAAFPGLCFTDTLMLENGFAGGDATGKLDFFSEENAERVQTEQAAPVTVIIGNPPYNVGQMNENENNKNRVHSSVARRLSATYVKDSKATNKNALRDMYVRFFRWATDRLGDRDYRTRYAENLKRELPRIPFTGEAAVFHAIAFQGKAMATLHTGYETAPEYPLKEAFDPQATLAEVFHVQKMRLTPDKTALIVNPHLTLTGIPPDAFQYKLGSRSALDWIIDQYRVKDGSDPNRPDEPDYIVKLIKRIVTVSVETVGVVAGLPPLGLGV